MKFFRKNIFTAASPNTTADDAWLAFKILLQPWTWYKKQDREEFRKAFSNYINQEQVHLIDSWRSGFYMVLKELGIKEGDEIILPSFTCVVVANAARWTGAKPIYLDTNENDFNANYNSLDQVITENTKAILIQHTFGKMVKTEDIRQKLKDLNRQDIVIIEDFAHVIHREMQLNGDIGIFTFGIEKVISSVRGGAIVVQSTKTNDERLEIFYNSLGFSINSLPKFPRKQVFKSLMNPIFWSIAIPLHSVGFGRFTLGAAIRGPWRKLGFLGIMVEDEENKAVKPNWFPAQMNSALARLGLHQLKKLDKFNSHREKIVGIYNKYLQKLSDEPLSEEDDVKFKRPIGLKRTYLRYPILTSSKEEFKAVWNKARKLGVTLGNWFAKPLYGASVDQETYNELCYVPALTPITSRKCGLTLNLPTSVNINPKRAEELARELSKVLKSVSSNQK